MVSDVFKDLRANDQIKAIVFERQLKNVRNSNSPHTFVIVSQILLILQSAFGLEDVVKANVNSHSDNFSESKSSTGVTTGSATDVKNTIAGFNRESVKVDGNQG
jgi:hypothetical protein